MSHGRRVTEAQVRELRKGLSQGASLRFAAMKAGMDRKTARKYRDGGTPPSGAQPAHTWRTRPDPLAGVWPEVEALLRGEPRLQAKTLLEWLQRRYPDRPWARSRRTLERRVRQWRAQHGAAKEVFFTQVHEPGRLGASDFTHMDDLGVTLGGQPFPHLLYHFVLTYSNWEYVALCFTESFASLSEGLQGAWWELGGAAQRHRTDRMTLAVHHEGNPEQYTARYQALLAHYGVTAEATNPASGHENGDCEQSHRRFKEAVEQALLLRGSRDFEGRAAYEQFLGEVRGRRNAGRHERFAEEQGRLRPLPTARLETAERRRVKVGRGSTLRVLGNTYSVPARLIGETVDVRIGADVIEVSYAGAPVQTMERLRGQAKHRIDYRHVIDWLVRKPGAFARYVYRDDLYPTVTYRRAYDALAAQQPGRADREYVRLLYLAAQEGEARVEAVLVPLLEAGQPLSEQGVRTLLGKETPLALAARVSVPAVDLRLYDALLEEAAAVSSDKRMSQENGDKEVTDEPGHDGGAGALPAGTAAGSRAQPVRGSGAASDGRGVELRDLPAGVGAARVSAAAPPPDRAPAQGLAAAAGEELGGVGAEAAAGAGGATVARLAERGVPGPARECAGLWRPRFGEDPRLVRGGPGADPRGPAGSVHEMQSAGARPAEGEARPAAEGTAPRPVALGGLADRRPGLRAAEPGGNGGAVHAAGGALRAGQRAADEQPGVLAMGADLQGPDDDGRRDRPVGTPQRHRRDERAELPRRVGEADTRRTGPEGGLRGRERQPWWGPGCATVAVAALRLPPRSQAPTTARFASGVWGILLVANGEA